MRTGLLAFVLAIFGLFGAELSPVRAQVSATVIVQNDDRFRGRSVSEGEPVAIVSAGYDHASGLYTSGSVAVTTNGDGVGVLRGSLNAGFVQSLDRNIALDTGVVVNRYTDRYSGARAQTFAEGYAGLIVRDVAVYAWVSPSYLDQDLTTLYVEANAVRDLGSGFRVNARVGVLNRLSGEGSFGGRDTRYDASVGVSKDFDRFTLSVTAGTAGSGEGTYFSGPWQGRDSVVVALSRSF